MSTFGNIPLKEFDPELADIIEHEKNRQWKSLELIASENFTSQAVLDCLGSCLTNKYSEGYPGHRYYGGNEYIDQIELLCIERALKAFHLNSNEWGVNVQPYSGSPANLAVYLGLLTPHSRIMGLELSSGGHLTHGHYIYSAKLKQRKSLSASSTYYESLPYSVDSTTGLIDYDKLEELAIRFKPELLIAGYSAYVRDLDYKRYRDIANKVGAILMMDMAHVSGLIASELLNNPFEYCDIVTTTTHKSLRGPRAAMVFYKKDERNFEQKISDSVFPGLQGGPHNNTIAGICTQLKDVLSDEYKIYCKQIILNAKALCTNLMSHGIKLVTDGTDNHIVLIDLRPFGLTGNKVEKLFDYVSITVNKNTIHGDISAFTPSGIRVGTPALTSRGLKESDFMKVGDFIHRGIELCVELQKKHGKKLEDFVNALKTDNDGISKLKECVESFAKSFPMPGMNMTDMKYH